MPEYPKVSFRIPADLRSSLQDIATEQGMTLSTLIKSILNEFVRQKQENVSESHLCHTLTAPSTEEQK